MIGKPLKTEVEVPQCPSCHGIYLQFTGKVYAQKDPDTPVVSSDFEVYAEFKCPKCGRIINVQIGDCVLRINTFIDEINYPR